MYSYPWYVREYWFVLFAIIIVVGTWFYRRYAIKAGKEVVFYEKPLPGIIGLVQMSKKETIRMGRSMARVGDLVFWFILFFLLIFTVVEFEYIFL